MAKETFERLVELKQQGEIGWLEFARRGDHAEDYAQWCLDHDMPQTEENAELFLEMTEEKLWEEQEGAV